jgi:excinuclease ABC subunit A
VIVVEHDERDPSRRYVLDIGPGGMHGGHIVAQGTPAEIMKNPKSSAGKYLTGEMVAIPSASRRTTGEPSRSSTPRQ